MCEHQDLNSGGYRPTRQSYHWTISPIAKLADLLGCESCIVFFLDGGILCNLFDDQYGNNVLKIFSKRTVFFLLREYMQL
jgi:hypothetical protein